MFEYGIDRLTMNRVGISNQNVDRIYRQLFMTTSGFLSTLDEILESQSNSFKLNEGVYL